MPSGSPEEGEPPTVRWVVGGLTNGAPLRRSSSYGRSASSRKSARYPHGSLPLESLAVSSGSSALDLSLPTKAGPPAPFGSNVRLTQLACNSRSWKPNGSC